MKNTGFLFLLNFLELLLLLVFISSSSSTSSSSTSSSTGWIQLPFPNPAPAPRVYAASTGGSPVPPPYSPADLSGIAFFGGTTDPTTYATCYNDLWILNAQDSATGDGRYFYEVPMSSYPIPAPRALAAIAIDSSQMTLYLYGGYDGTNWYSDLWSVDLSVVHYTGNFGTWAPVDIMYGASPPPLCGLTLTWVGTPEFGAPDQIFLFGGGSDKRELYNNVYVLTIDPTNTTWTKPQPAVDWPTAREFHSSWLDYQGEMYVFGGYDYGYSFFNDTWFFNYPNEEPGWYLSSSPFPPPPSRCCSAAAYSIRNLQAMIWGGRDYNDVFDDLWYLTSGNWTQINYSSPEFGLTPQGSSPEGRYGMVSGYFEEQNALIVWGGISKNGTLFNDVWYFPFKDSYDD